MKNTNSSIQVPATMETAEQRQPVRRPASRRWLSYLLAMLAILIASAAGLYGWQSGDASILDVGTATDASYITNFYDAESGPDGINYRWGRDNPSVRLPAVRAPALLTLRMAGRPGGAAIQLIADGQTAAAFEVKGEELRRYKLLWRGAVLADTASVKLEVPAKVVPPEKRSISVLVDAIQLTPLLNGIALLPPGFAAMFALFGLAVYLLPSLLGIHRMLALALAAFISIALTLAWMSIPVLVAPYMWSLSLGLVVISAVLLLVHSGTGQRLNDLELLSGLIAFGALTAFYAARVDQAGPLYAGLALLAGLAALVGLLRWRLQPVFVVMAVLAMVALVVLQLAGIYADGIELRGSLNTLFRAAARLSYGTLPLYNLTELDTNPFSTTFSDPPLVALLMMPLARMRLEEAGALWRSINLTLLLPAGLALLAAAQIQLRSWATAGVLLALLAAPTISAIADGQITLILLLLLSLAVWALVMDRNFWYGGAVGAMAALSPIWALLLLPALIQRRWRAFPAAALAFTLLTMLSIVLAGWQNQQIYVLAMLPWALTSTSWVENQSLSALINRLFEVDRLAAQPGLGGMVQQIGLGLGVLLLILTALQTWRRTTPADLTLALWIVAILLAIPVSWIFQQTLIVPVFAIVLGRAYWRGLGISWPVAACTMLAWMLIAQGDRWLFYDGKLLGSFWQLILSYKTYGMVLLYAAIALEIRDSGKQGTSKQHSPHLSSVENSSAH